MFYVYLRYFVIQAAMWLISESKKLNLNENSDESKVNCRDKNNWHRKTSVQSVSVNSDIALSHLSYWFVAPSRLTTASQTTCQSGAASNRPHLILAYDTFHPAWDPKPDNLGSNPDCLGAQKFGTNKMQCLTSPESLCHERGELVHCLVCIELSCNLSNTRLQAKTLGTNMMPTSLVTCLKSYQNWFRSNKVIGTQYTQHSGCNIAVNVLLTRKIY